VSFLFHTVGPKLMFLAGTAVFGFYLVKGFRTGSMKAVYGIYVSRKEDPDGFWIMAIFHIFVILCCLLGAAMI
jgi:hypothetical protein